MGREVRVSGYVTHFAHKVSRDEHIARSQITVKKNALKISLDEQQNLPVDYAAFGQIYHALDDIFNDGNLCVVPQ